MCRQTEQKKHLQAIFDNIIKKLQLNNYRGRLDDKDKHPITLFLAKGTFHLLDSTMKPNKSTEYSSRNWGAGKHGMLESRGYWLKKNPFLVCNK